jgi:hypothetical protein
MKRSALPILLVVAFCCAHSSRGAAVIPSTSQRSENGLFSADISSGAPNEILVAIHRHEGEIKIVSWSKKVRWNGANATFTSFPWLKRYISNDGQTVILHNQQFRDASWVWISKGAEPNRIYPYDLNRVLGQNFNENSFSNPFVNASDLLQFVFDEQGVHAIWFPALDKWLTIDLKTGALTSPHGSLAEALKGSKAEIWLKPPSEDLIRLLNAEASRRSILAVRKHQPTALSTMLKPVQEKLGQLIPSLKPAAQARRDSLSESYAAYLFLARHKVAEGERYIRKLLGLPFEQKHAFTSWREVPEFTAISFERMLGDMAWRLWNEVPVERQPGPGFYGDFDKTTASHYLGGVRGHLRLPMVRPDTNPGAVWIYLIRTRVKPGAWPTSRIVVPLYCNLDFAGGAFRGASSPQFDAIDYRFATIAPGEYRLKAVWDRRPPIAPESAIAIPEAGDYESAESAPFTIAAGATLAGPELDCTNRVGQADNYYAADESWKKVTPKPNRDLYARRYGGSLNPWAFRDIVDDRQSGWAIKTNMAAKNLEFKRADVIQVLPIGALLERDELILTFSVKDLSDLSLRKLVPQLKDEHGCLFKANAFVPAPRTGPGELTVRAGVFPRKKEFTVSLRSATEDKVICSYTIKNGGSSQTAKWRSRPLPLSRTIGERNIRLASLTRSTGARFELVSNSGAADWTPETVIYQDREGNRSFEADDFCRQDKEIKVQIEHEAQTREFITEFPDKR